MCRQIIDDLMNRGALDGDTAERVAGALVLLATHGMGQKERDEVDRCMPGARLWCDRATDRKARGSIRVRALLGQAGMLEPKVHDLGTAIALVMAVGVAPGRAADVLEGFDRALDRFGLHEVLDARLNRVGRYARPEVQPPR